MSNRDVVRVILVAISVVAGLYFLWLIRTVLGMLFIAVFALIYFFQALAWFFNDLLDVIGTSPWIGFLIVFGILIAFAGLAGWLGIRWIKKGSPPTPALAIEEAKRTRAEILEHN